MIEIIKIGVTKNDSKIEKEYLNELEFLLFLQNAFNYIWNFIESQIKNKFSFHRLHDAFF